MIKYTLKCSQEHSFESWFDSAEAYEKLERGGHLSCAVCGSGEVKRAIMAPSVASTAENAVKEKAPTELSSKNSISELRKKVEENSENVGAGFANEARAIHDGEAPARAIYGEANLDDAKSLINDGVPVVPLPWSKKRTN